MSKLVKKGNLLKKRDMKKLAAVELMASDPDITGKEISDLIDINQNIS